MLTLFVESQTNFLIALHSYVYKVAIYNLYTYLHLLYAHVNECTVRNIFEMS